MPSRSLTLGLVLAASALAGCGQGVTPAPDTTTPSAPQGAAQRSFPITGVSFTAPANWTVDPGDGDQVATVSSATAAIGVFRYARVEQLPSSRSQLDAAADRLAEAAKVRDPTFAETGRDVSTRIDGLRAIELRGTGTILGRPKVIHSVHVLGRRGEVVVDLLADARDAARLDTTVLTPLLASLQVQRPRT